MANTVTERILLGDANSPVIVKLVHIVYVDTQETDRVIFDNSALWNNVNAGSLVDLVVSGSDCLLRLEWDQTADSPIISVVPSGIDHICFKEYGGIKNPQGEGATGDILLTTTGLAAGEEITLILTVRR